MNGKENTIYTQSGDCSSLRKKLSFATIYLNRRACADTLDTEAD